MNNYYSVLVDKNKESWLAIEENVIRVFTTKNSAIEYRNNNKGKVETVLHRYSDGTLQPLLNWPNEPPSSDLETIEQVDHLVDELETKLKELYDELDNINDNKSFRVPIEEPIKEE